jgi:DNA polymerase III subunit epsilon
MANYLFIDVETTGLGSNAAMIEIAAIPYINGEEKPHFHSMIKPHVGCTIDPRAFEITKIDFKELDKFPSATGVLDEFFKWIDSHETIFNLAGHNVKFDRNHLFRLCCRNGDYGKFITRFSNNDIDTLSISRALFKGKRNKPSSFKLEGLCEYFDIEVGVSHRALRDIQNTIKLFMELEKIKIVEEEKTNPELSYIEAKTKFMDMKYIQMNPDGDVFITKDALADKQAVRFILNFLWEKHVSEV